MSYEKGNKVWRKNYRLSSAPEAYNAKLGPKFLGPFVVANKVSDLVYRLSDDKGTDRGLWHVADLKPFQE